MSANAIAVSVNAPNTVLLAAKEVLQVYVSLPWSLQICSFYSDIYVTALLQIYSFLLQSCHWSLKCVPCDHKEMVLFCKYTEKAAYLPQKMNIR